MAKRPTLSDITNIETAAPIINANNDRIELAFDNTLSRDGSTPNQMEADLDMNSNDLLNVGAISALDIIVDGQDLGTIVDEAQFWANESEKFRDEAEVLVNSIGDVQAKNFVDHFVGDGVQTTFILVEPVPDEDFTQVYVDGLYQDKHTYSVSGNDIIFDVAPAVDSHIEVMSIAQSVVGQTDATAVTYNNTSVQVALDNLNSQAINFDTRAELATAIQLGDVLEGEYVTVRGVVAVIDETATGNLSALHDLGQDGVRFPFDFIEARWWTEEAVGDASALITAMNDHADAAYSSPKKVVTVRFNGLIQLANQVTLGTTGSGVTKSFNIDAKGAIFEAISGGDLDAGDKTMIRIKDCHRSMIEFSQLLCNHISGGITVENCSNSVFDGMHFHQFAWRGLWVRGQLSTPTAYGNSSGSVFNKVTGAEWTNGETEYNDDTNFVATGIVNDSHDVRFTFAHIGWCRRAILNNAGSCEFISCHPFNGNAGTPSQAIHRICFENNGGGNVNIYDMYGDNGYVIDNTGGLKINGLVMLDLNSIMTHPYVRIRTDGNTLNNDITNCRTDIGFYSGDFDPTFSNENTSWQHDISGGGFDAGNVREVGRKWVRYLYGEATPDELTIKETSGTGTTIVQRFKPGNGDVALQFRNNHLVVQNGTTTGGQLRLSTAARTGIECVDTGGTFPLVFYANGAVGRFRDDGDFVPQNDNTQRLGDFNARWSEVYAGNGAINTSDERDKQDIEPISDAILDAWATVEFVQYRWAEMVNQKGEEARKHFGVIAQKIAAAFLAQGIDPFQFGLLCYDEWVDEEGISQNKYGVRMDQCYALECALNRRERAKLEQRIAALEAV